MALLTAEDILNKKFTATKFREGYDVEEVDDFLDEVVRTLAAVQEENDDLKAKLAAAERRVAELSMAAGSVDAAPVQVAAPVEPVAPEPVAPVTNPLVAAAAVAGAAGAPQEPEAATGMLALAQKLHDDYVRSGQDEGDRLVSDAKVECARMIREAEETSHRTLTQLENERTILERKIDELRLFERDYRTRMKSFLSNLLGEIDSRGNSMPARSDSPMPGGQI
jgi:DivIVA domain-containing protein